MNTRLLVICSRCDKATAIKGRVRCGYDGLDPVAHATSGDCPEGRFSMTAPPVATIPDDYDPAHYALDSKGTEGCGC